VPICETVISILSPCFIHNGVGAMRNPPLWMKHGDRIEITVSQIGTLRNTVRDEMSPEMHA